MTGRSDKRGEANVQHLAAEGKVLGADAIVGMRLTASAVTQGAAEIVAYGTAVKLTY